METLKEFFTPKRIIAYGLMILAFVAVALFAPHEQVGIGEYQELIELNDGALPEELSTFYGAWTLAIPALMFVFCILTHGFLEAFIWSTALVTFMRFRLDFLPAMVETQLGAMMDYDNIRMIVLYLLIGSVLAAISKGGGARAFAEIVRKKAKSSKLALVIMWIMDVFLSIDDELSAFTTGTAITPLNDGYGIPREKSAVMIRLTAVAPANLWQLGAWVVFVAVLLEQSGFAASGQGVVEYMKCVPFMFFPIIALILALLYALGIVPDIGPVKRAVKRVKEGGPIAPVASDGSTKNDASVSSTEIFTHVKPRLINFILPVVVLVGVSFLYDFDIMVGIIACLVFTFILFVAQGVCTPSEFIEDVFLGGMHDMLMLTALFAIGVNFCTQLGEMGFAEYIISITASFLSPKMFPFIVFVVFSITEFLCSFNWTLYMMALPIIIPMCGIIGANPYIAVAALICAGIWGSMGCMYSDGALVAAAATDCDAYEASSAALPYMLICEVLSAILFLVAGFIF